MRKRKSAAVLSQFLSNLRGDPKGLLSSHETEFSQVMAKLYSQLYLPRPKEIVVGGTTDLNTLGLTGNLAHFLKTDFVILVSQHCQGTRASEFQIS